MMLLGSCIKVINPVFVIVSIALNPEATFRMRKFFAILSGAVGGSLIFFMVAYLANLLHPTPPELMDPQTPEAVAKRVAATATVTWLIVIIGHALGAFSGGIIGNLITRKKSFWVTLIIGLAFSLWAFYTFYVVFPASLWVPLIMLVNAFVFSYLGSRVLKPAI